VCAAVQVPRLRPLGIGEILDTAIKIYRSRFATLVKAVLVVVAPVQILTAVVQISIPKDTIDPVTQEVDVAAAVGAGAAIAIVTLLGFIAAQLATATVFKIISSAYLGEHEDWRSSLRFALRRLHRVIWVAVLPVIVLVLVVAVSVVLALLLTLWSIPIILAFAAGLVYLYFCWYFAIPALLMEDRRGTKALRRSRQLVRGRFWPSFAAVVIAIMLAGVVAAALQGAVLAVVLSTDNELVETVVQAIAGTATSALVTPFSAAAILVIYFDLRVRKEGFDLELLARTLGTDVPPELLEAGGAGAFELAPTEGPAAPGEQPPFWPPPPGWRPGS
jgi:MFS family permease